MYIIYTVLGLPQVTLSPLTCIHNYIIYNLYDNWFVMQVCSYTQNQIFTENWT